MPKDSAPQFVRYLGPVLEALQSLGGSGRPDEVRSVIAQKLKLSEEEQSEPLPSKAQPRFDNQVHWARFYLSKAGFLDSSKRGVWVLPVPWPIVHRATKLTCLDSAQNVRNGTA
jgi:restriction system protein